MLSIDTFYVCTLKGIRRISQFTTIDATAYLYTDKSIKFSVDFISKTLDTFKALGISVERGYLLTMEKNIPPPGIQVIIPLKSI